MYAIDQLATLGFDLVRLPAGRDVAEVLLTGLDAGVADLHRLAAVHPAEGRTREQRGVLAIRSRRARELAAAVAFPRQDVSHTLAEEVSAAGLRQFHVAETEKYAHVTYFINGGREEPFPGEERLLVPSPRVATYDATPAMSAVEVSALMEERAKVEIEVTAVVPQAL